MNDRGTLGLIKRSDNLLITWKSPKPRRGGGVVARDGGCIRGRERDKRAHREINNMIRIISHHDNITEARCKSGGLRHNGKNDIYSHAETSGARRGAFFRFSRPTLRRFSRIFAPFRQRSILAYRWRSSQDYHLFQTSSWRVPCVLRASTTPPPHHAPPPPHPRRTRI